MPVVMEALGQRRGHPDRADLSHGQEEMLGTSCKGV